MCATSHASSARLNLAIPLAAEQLLPLIYEELRKLAAAKTALEKPDQMLQATALVHDGYIRLVDVGKGQHWNSRGHFFTAAAEAMRRPERPATAESETRWRLASRGNSTQMAISFEPD